MGHPAARLWLTWVFAQAAWGLVGFAAGGLATLGGPTSLANSAATPRDSGLTIPRRNGRVASWSGHAYP